MTSSDDFCAFWLWVSMYNNMCELVLLWEQQVHRCYGFSRLSPFRIWWILSLLWRPIFGLFPPLHRGFVVYLVSPKKKKKMCELVFTLTNYYYYLLLYKRQVVLFQPPYSIKLPFSCTFRSFSFGIVIPFVCVVSNHIINLKSFNFRLV